MTTPITPAQETAEERLALELGFRFRLDDGTIEYASYDENEQFTAWQRGNFVYGNVVALWRKCLELSESQTEIERLRGIIKTERDFSASLRYKTAEAVRIINGIFATALEQELAGEQLQPKEERSK